MDDKTKKLLNRIRALRAKAEDPSVTEAEAALFAAKVQELLTEHGLSMADVSSAGARQQDDMGGTTVAERWKSPARKHLLRSVCRFYMCEAVSPGWRGGSWTIVGRPTNVTVALDMVDYLISTTVRLSNEYGRNNRGAGVNIIDFRRGCMARLAERLDEMRRAQQEKKAEYTPSGNPGNLPALFRSERDLVKDFMKQKMDITFRKSAPIREGGDAQAGRRAADSIGLHSQVGGGGGRLMIGSK